MMMEELDGMTSGTYSIGSKNSNITISFFKFEANFQEISHLKIMYESLA
jgi:hypothetical protein